MADLAELGVTDFCISQLRAEAVRLLRAGLHEPWHGTPEPTGPDTKTFGPRVFAARRAYVAAVAARSTTTARLRHTTALAEFAETQPRHTRAVPNAHVVHTAPTAHGSADHIASTTPANPPCKRDSYT